MWCLRGKKLTRAMKTCLAGIPTALTLLSAWLFLCGERTAGRAELIENKSESVALRSPGETGPDLGGGCEFCDKDKKDGGLVFIKSFKTGSTTLATYIAQVGHQRGSYFLHPLAKGWFAQGELESRRDQGERYDISLRHVTPYTPYDVLEDLVPGAQFVTIMREPVERFLSLFNFRGELKRRYKTPHAIIAAIRAGKLPESDARPFCNQMAWLLSGKDIGYATNFDEDEAGRIAEDVIAEANRRNVTVLMTERMSESIAVLANLMHWKMGDLPLRVASQRVGAQSQAAGGAAARRKFPCPGDSREACSREIRGCNLVDEKLYTHYQRVFDDLVQQLPSLTSGPASSVPADVLNRMPRAQASMSRLELGIFPASCFPSNRQGKDETAHEKLHKRLHSCDGRPA